VRLGRRRQGRCCACQGRNGRDPQPVQGEHGIQRRAAADRAVHRDAGYFRQCGRARAKLPRRRQATGRDAAGLEGAARHRQPAGPAGLQLRDGTGSPGGGSRGAGRPGHARARRQIVQRDIGGRGAVGSCRQAGDRLDLPARQHRSPRAVAAADGGCPWRTRARCRRRGRCERKGLIRGRRRARKCGSPLIMIDLIYGFGNGLISAGWWTGAAWPTAWALIKIIVLVAPLMGAVAYLTLWERKAISFTQIRIGPNRIGPSGLLQPIADAVKLMTKEIILPTMSAKGLFYLGPIMTIMPALVAWVVIPFGPEIAVANVNAGLLLLMAITSMEVYGVIIAGWASNSKYAFLG